MKTPVKKGINEELKNQILDAIYEAIYKIEKKHNVYIRLNVEKIEK